MAKKKKTDDEVHYCRECLHCSEVWFPQHLLTINGEPTLGDCPFVDNRRVLLSERSCERFVKRKYGPEGIKCDPS